jgi:DNA polymerase III subunit gamma/tau
MESVQHFARTLRPTKLSEVIGQDFVVSMLQNSLYLGRFFPVYLFHGQRGCGKTTVARIIASMINCSQLEAFRQNPRGTTLPCQTCPSCIASTEGNHPDFIEIDAASHTGVDHVRTILESAHYLPLLGKKKIYLIDEAHMLSKAAFNALLKMLEEPPSQALFILATTEVAKIPITVKSRSFQGIFNAPEQSVVVEYLKKVAGEHGMTLDDEAAHLIATKADRCVRDSLNLLEQLGAIDSTITAQTVTHVLGLPDKVSLINIMKAVITKDQTALFEALSSAKHSDKNPISFWHALSESFQSLVRASFNAPGLGIFASSSQELKEIAALSTPDQRAYINTQFWNAERIFNVTTSKMLFIEHFLSSLCNPLQQQVNAPHKAPAPAAPAKPRTHAQYSPPSSFPSQETAAQTPENLVPKTAPKPEANPLKATEDNPSWHAFLAELSVNPDKIPFGIFKQAQPILNGSSLVVEIPNFNAFLEDQLNDRSASWKDCLKRHMNMATSFALRSAPPAQSTPKTAEPAQNPTFSSRALAEGPTTDLIMKYFPGKLV